MWFGRSPTGAEGVQLLRQLVCSHRPCSVLKTGPPNGKPSVIEAEREAFWSEIGGRYFCGCDSTQLGALNRLRGFQELLKLVQLILGGGAESLGGPPVFLRIHAVVGVLQRSDETLLSQSG